MPYTREELDWIEAEWAFHLHGRTAFLSREDFLQVQAWAAQGLPADLVVGAMEAFFARRATRAKAKGFVAMAHLERDVAKARLLREALKRAGAEGGASEAAPLASKAPKGWTKVKPPLRQDPRAKACFEQWQRLKAAAPLPDSPNFLDHFDAERKAFKELVALAEAALGPQVEVMKSDLKSRLLEARMEEGSLVWRRAWDHHWTRKVCEAWGIDGD